MRVLVVEDEVDLADAIALGLRRESYAVDVANDGNAALERLAVSDYDLVCLDLTLPGVDGRTICQKVKNGEFDRHETDDDPGAVRARPRVLMLTARDGLDDRVAGLDDGADDYLVKPFAFTELTARVRSLMRRDGGQSGAVLTAGDIAVDTVRHVARRGSRVLDLTAKEFALLRYFVAHAGEVLSQEHLLEHVWDENADPFTNTVRVTVGTLRRKLSTAGEPRAIETVVGAGYRLVVTR